MFRVRANHPSLPGHFPGRPVVPGVVLLDEVIAVLAILHPGQRVLEMPRVKFSRPVRPDQDVVVQSGAGAGGRLAFLCRVDGQDVLGGTLLLGPA